MIAVIDSGGANLSSVMFALERLGLKASLTRNIGEIEKAERVILPGVGTAGEVMRMLEKNDLINCVLNLKQPVLGICVGMQILYEWSAESNIDMLHLIPGKVQHFRSAPEKIIPHMGWNNLSKINHHPVLQGIDKESYFYFVHSYCADEAMHTIGTCTYSDQSFSAVVAKNNFVGCQFHPERSGRAGAQILQNFAAWQR
jgi:glutamine amidotransferase